MIKKVLLSFVMCSLLVAQGYSQEKAFKPSWKSLAENYKCPDWFRDAKFGIFMHWGVQSALDENRPYGGSHYGRYMYGPGEFPPEDERSKDAIKLFNWHKAKYGDQNDKGGYVNLIPLFKAEKWDPDSLVKFFKSCGAKYIVPVAVHHDNYDLYNSIHPWNSVKIGPKKDIIKGWKEAAEKNGIRFGVSSHLDRVPAFFQCSRKYDGKRADRAEFYASNYMIEHQKDERWQKQWYNRTMQLIDNYQPDLLYFDGSLPGIYGNMTYGYEVAAHFYNSNIKKHNGNLEAVMTLKHGPDKRAFTWDIERGQSDALQVLPWQTDTDLQGGWYYHKAKPQFTPDVLIGNFVDIVSKNGNLLLNVGLKGDGTLPDNQADVLRQMGKWLNVNGEGIFGSRPWIVYGEGPTKIVTGAFKEQKSAYTSQDIRFTTKNGYLYAFVLKIPEKNVNIMSLAQRLTLVNQIEKVELLGYKGEIQWKQMYDSLQIEVPKDLPCDYALCFKIKVDDKSRQTWEQVIE